MYLSPEAPCFADRDTNTIFINRAWYNSKELPFAAAHEVAHVINGDAGTLYYHNIVGHSAAEAKADRGAVDIPVPMYCEDVDAEYANPYRLMGALSIPESLHDYVCKTMSDYYEN